MIFAASCVESAAIHFGCSSTEMYERMAAVDLINGYILKHYQVLHSESREYVTEDVINCLLAWEARKAQKK